jgi:hypothetical protein
MQSALERRPAYGHRPDRKNAYWTDGNRPGANSSPDRACVVGAPAARIVFRPVLARDLRAAADQSRTTMNGMRTAAWFGIAGLLIGAFAFGAGAAERRRPASPEPTEAADASVDSPATNEAATEATDAAAADADSNKDLAKFVRALRKRLKKDEGFYVLKMMEAGVVRDEAAGEARDSNVAYMPYSSTTFEVLGGRDAAIERIVEYLGEHNPPWEKKSARGKRGEASEAGPPAPRRDWQMVAWFPKTQEGLEQAEAARNQAQQSHDAQVKAIEDRNKPKCNCPKAAAQ